IKDLPYRDPGPEAHSIANALVELHKWDWDSSETSWSFQRHVLLAPDPASTVESSFENWDEKCRTTVAKAKELEEENNRLFIEAFGLQDELSAEVPLDDVTLYRPSREEDIKRLISYAVGCIMGRYSLDKPGLIYAH